MYLESLGSEALHSNGLLSQAPAGQSKLVLAWRGIPQNWRGTHQRAPWPHCYPSLSTEAFFPKTWQLFLLGRRESVPQLEFWLCRSWFGCWRINAYLGALFSTSTLTLLFVHRNEHWLPIRQSICCDGTVPDSCRAGMLQRAGTSGPCVWRGSSEGRE